MTRDIYEGVDSDGTGGDGVRRCAVTGSPCGTDTWAEGCPCLCLPCQAYLNEPVGTVVSGRGRDLVHRMVPFKLGGMQFGAVLLLAALAITGCVGNPSPQGPAQPTPAPIEIPPVVVDMAACWLCQYSPSLAAQKLCEAQFCPASPATPPTPEPRPRQEPTVASTEPATPSPTVPPATTPTAGSPTVAPHPSPTSAGPWMTAAPCEIGGVNGCDASNPASVGATGECGFTAFCRCPLCIHNRNWPADQDHAHWTAPEEPGVFVDDQGNRHAPFGTCPTTGDPESIATCASDGGRAWDATCASVKAAGGFIKVLSGNVRLDPVPGKNCYAGYISGNGTYQVRMPAGARACKDPHDYLRDEDWVDGCKHGEVLLTDHDVSLGGPVRVDR
jgi:hypothetical protein